MLLPSKTMATTQTVTQTAPEARSGLDPWRIGELPAAPRPRGLQWFNAVGPGVIVLGASIGSGEFLLGPAAFVKYGLSLLWIVGTRGAATDTAQRRVDALHHGDRRTGRHRIHARTRHTPPSGPGSMPCFTFSRWDGPVGQAPRRAQSSFWLRSVCRALAKREWSMPSASVFIYSAD